MRKLLKSLDLISDVELIGPTRDNPNVLAFRDKKTGVIFFEGERVDIPVERYWDDSDTLDDDRRRVIQFDKFIRKQIVLDFGCGNGGFIREAGNIPWRIFGFDKPEVMDHFGIRYNEGPYDVVTAFHVLEHLDDPIGVLRKIKDNLVVGGQLIIEVPHAREALSELYHCEAYNKFRLWSDHRMIHTKESLGTFLQFAGFSNIKIEYYQRFGLGNHMHWMTEGTPSGLRGWDFLDVPEYKTKLCKMQMSDTLIGYATNG